MRRMMFAVLGIAVLGLVGCKSDCQVTCEEAQDCPQSQNSAFAQALDCGDACDLAEDLYDELGCGGEFDDYYACGADNLDKICDDTGDLCRAENERFGNACNLD